MLTVKNIKVYDLRESVIACRYAMLTELPDINSDKNFTMGLERAKALASSPSNSGHCNFLKGIRVSFDLIYPNYISPELQRYNWIDIVTSSSKMHKIMRMDFGKCCNKYVTEETKAMMRRLVASYNEACVCGTKDDQYEAFMTVISNCPQGIELFMRISTNYLQLRNIYAQRKNHRLKEDWGAFCDFIRSLPYAKEFLTNGE